MKTEKVINFFLKEKSNTQITFMFEANTKKLNHWMFPTLASIALTVCSPTRKVILNNWYRQSTLNDGNN
jgi:hypothetical protein